MKIPFNISKRPQIESGEYKVILDCGVEAEILAWDKPGAYPIVCMAKKEGAIPFRTDNNGIAYNYPEGSNYSDLFIITQEPEFTEFEKRLWEIMKSEGSPIGSMDKFTQDDKRVFHAYSNQLLELAREELEPEVLERLKLAYKTQYENGKQDGKAEALNEIEQDPESSYAFKRGFEYGKEEAMKDLPKWGKCGEDTGQTILYKSFCDGQNYLEMDGYRIMLSDLKKLPGFNE